MTDREVTNGAVNNKNAQTQLVNRPAISPDTQQTSFLGSISHAWQALRHRNFRKSIRGLARMLQSTAERRQSHFQGKTHRELVSLHRLFLRRNVFRECRASFRAWHFW